MVPERFAPGPRRGRARLAERFAAAGHARSTSSAGSCATCCSSRRRSSGDFDLTTDARPDEIKELLRGWADAVWTPGRALRHDRRSEGRARRYEITTHRAEAYTDRLAASPTSCSRTRSRSTCPARLHRQRDGARASPRAGARRSVRRRRRSLGRSDCARRCRRRRASATTRCACCGPLASSPATASSPTPSSSPPCGPCTTGWRSCRRNASATSSTSCIVLDRPGPGLWFIVDTGLADEFLPELPAMRLEQDPIHRHKDVLAHTIAVVENVQPRSPGRSSTSGAPAWPRCSTTSASRRPARTAGARASRSTTTRWWGRA